MPKSLHIIVEKCTGCMQCELACSYINEGEFNPALSRIKVFHFHDDARYSPYTCTQCAEAWCLHACPVDAIKVDRDLDRKIVDAAICVGCKVCTIACPFGTVNYNPASGKVYKCDLCGGEPECVEVCPTNAILYIDSGSTVYEKMRSWAAKSDPQVA